VKHHLFSGRKISYGAAGMLGASRESFARPLEWRAQRLAKKSPPARSSSRRSYATTCRCSGLHAAGGRARSARQSLILVAWGPCAPPRRRVDPHSRSRVHIPDEIISASRARAEGALEAAAVHRAHPGDPHHQGRDGVHVMLTARKRPWQKIIERSGVLGGRVPWYPGRDPRRIPTGWLHDRLL